MVYHLNVVPADPNKPVVVPGAAKADVVVVTAPKLPFSKTFTIAWKDLLIKKPSLLDCSPCCQDPIIQRQSVFNSLKSVHNNLNDKVKNKS